MRKLSLSKDDCLTYKIRFASPVRLGSGDADKPSDFFRVASLRGAFRFWYRAMIGDQNAASLKKGEADIFGDTAKGSKVILRAEGTMQGGAKFVVSEPRRSSPPDGNGYLGYSFRRTGRTPERYPLEIRKEIILHVYFRNCTEDERIKAEAAIWLALHFGGIGMRSRRGYGSIQGEITHGNPAFLPVEVYNDSDTLYNGISEGVSNILGFSQAPAGNLPKYPVIASGNFLFAIFNKDFDNSKQALDYTGRKYFDWRIGNNYTQPAGRGNGIDQKHNHHNRQELGLPITNGPGGRLASPLFFHLHGLKDGKISVVSCAFRHQRSPKGLAMEFLKYLDKNEIAICSTFEGE